MHTVVKIKHSEYERYGIKWYYSIIKIVTAAALLLANGVHLSDGLVGCNLRYSRWASGLWENGSLVPGNLMWIKPESDESQLCHPGISIRIFHSVCLSHFLFMTQFPNAAVNFDLTIWSNPRNCPTSSDDDLAENCCSLQPDPHQITRTRTKWLSEDPSSDMFKKLEAAYCSQDETAWNQLKHSHDWDHGPQKILTCMLKFTGREAFNLISICVRVCVFPSSFFVDCCVRAVCCLTYFHSHVQKLAPESTQNPWNSLLEKRLCNHESNPFPEKS